MSRMHTPESSGPVTRDHRVHKDFPSKYIEIDGYIQKQCLFPYPELQSMVFPKVIYLRK